VHNLKLKQITIALCVALMPISSFAAGLGKLNVSSALGEPLKADIELISVTPAELENITAAIASEETYATQGLEKPASHTGIKVEIGKNASGAPVLKLKSNQAINEPFLDMLIQVDWSTGRLLREYTVLLDPPGYVGDQASFAPSTVDNPTVAPTANNTSSVPNSVALAPQAEDKPIAKKGKSKKNAKKKVEEVEVAAAEVTGTEYTTERGDTLMKIARDMQPQGVSLEQMLVGLYDANPEAFAGNNMNRLKVGQIIRQPTQEALNAISKGEAQREVKVQAANWNEYRNKLAGMVADAPVAAADTTAQSSSGKIKGAAEDQSVAASSGPKDVVKLSAADAASKPNDAKAAQAKIAALQEEATARENSVKEAQSRAADLEKQISDMQKLLALKNNAMADMQKQSAAKPAEPASPVETAKPADAPKTAETPAAQAAEPAKPADAAPAVEAPKPVAPATPAVKPVVKPAPVLPPPVEEEGFVSSVLSSLDLSTILPVGGLLVALGGGWLFLRNRRKKNLADFEQGIMTSGGLKANTVFGNTSGASVDTGDTSFLTDFSQSGTAGMIDTNDVDPIAEAEVYMAYGRDAQAEEILKDAIVKEPKRYELHLKLLEMYAASQNNSAFEAISGELYTTLGADSPEWAKVAEIGIQLEPNNPLYQVKAGASAVAKSQTDKSVTEKLDISDFSNIPLADESDLDQSSDQLTKVRSADASAAKPVSDSSMDEFDLDFGADELTPVSATESFSASSKQDDGQSIQFEAPTDSPSVAEATDIKQDDLNFDMGDLGLNFEQQTEEPVPVATIAIEEEVPTFDISTFGENSLNVDAISNELDMVDVQSPDTINLDVKTAVFPATFAPNETGNSIADLDALSSSYDEDNKDLNIPTISNDAADFMKADFSEANTIDISNISLDLNDEPAEAAAEEPADVETKLELVAAYIDMDDAEGAKELIAEVVAEGGPNQRKRAEALLAKLG